MTLFLVIFFALKSTLSNSNIVKQIGEFVTLVNSFIGLVPQYFYWVSASALGHDSSE